MSKKLFIPLLIILAIATGYLVKTVLATSNPHTWTNGLVGYWSFDGQYTTSTDGTKDVSGNGNYGQFKNGVKPIAGIVGQALSFDGVNDYVDCGTGASLNITGDITMEAWVKFNTLSGIQNIAGNSRSDNYGSRLIWNGSSFDYSTYQAGDSQLTRAVYTPVIGTWYHIVVTRSGTSAEIYLNGIDITSTLASHIDPASSLVSFKIGVYSYSPTTQFFNGLIDEVRIYSRALSADEVKQHYDQTKRNFVINNPSGTPPVAWWKMDEPTGAQVRDYSVNGNNGTPSGTASTDGKIGKALNFDGVDDYVDCGNSSIFGGMTALTMEAWIKPNSLHTGRIFERGASGTENRILLQTVSDGTLSLTINDTDSITGGSYTPGNWYHLVATWIGGGGVKALYVNGINVASGISTQASVTAGSITTNIGQSPWYALQKYDGLIDDVRIYNYARTAEQIAADYRAGSYRTIVASSVPSTWWTDGLVGYWNFDGPNTTSTNGTRDTSGQNNWGAFNGGVKPTAGIVGQALSFDGVDDYVNIANESNFDFEKTDSFTMDTWIKFQSNVASAGTIFGKVTGGTGYFAATYLGKVYMQFYDSGGYYSRNSLNQSLNNNQWHHIAFVYNGSGDANGVTVYIDGAGNTGTIETSGAVSSILNDNNPRIGERGTDSTYFNGLIDEVRIYNRALSADEVMTHYQQTRRNLGI